MGVGVAIGSVKSTCGVFDSGWVWAVVVDMDAVCADGGDDGGCSGLGFAAVQNEVSEI